jgi:hypothetical protein
MQEQPPKAGALHVLMLIVTVDIGVHCLLMLGLRAT